LTEKLYSKKSLLTFATENMPGA